MVKAEHSQAAGAGGRTSPDSGCLVVGLMGGIGSGKSTVARVLAELGARVLDADALCAELHETPQVKAAVRRRWGDAVFNAAGRLDSAALAAIVFDHPDELAELNRIIHPRVIERIERDVAACRVQGDLVLCVIDAPLLFESGLTHLCDLTLFIECDETRRAQRVARSRQWAPEEIERREARQQSLARKREMADVIVDNSGDLAALRRQVQEILARFRPNGD